MQCCFCINIKTGCFIGAMVFMIIAFIKVVLCIVVPLQEGPRTIIILNILLIFLAATMLIIGSIMEDRICIICFIFFDIGAILIQALGLTVVYIGHNYKIPASLLAVLVTENLPFIYMIPIGIVEFHIVKEKHLAIAETYGNPHSEPMTTNVLVPVLGF